MQNAETKMEGKKRAMVLPDRANFSAWIAVAIVAFLALQAVVVVASAHETGSPHDELPPPWPYHVLLVTTGVVVMLGGNAHSKIHEKEELVAEDPQSLAISGAVLTVFGFIVAAYMVSTYMETYLVMEPHAYLGISALALVVLAPILGFMQFRTKDKRMHTIHR